MQIQTTLDCTNTSLQMSWNWLLSFGRLSSRCFGLHTATLRFLQSTATPHTAPPRTLCTIATTTTAATIISVKCLKRDGEPEPSIRDTFGTSVHTFAESVSNRVPLQAHHHCWHPVFAGWSKSLLHTLVSCSKSKEWVEYVWQKCRYW